VVATPLSEPPTGVAVGGSAATDERCSAAAAAAGLEAALKLRAHVLVSTTSLVRKLAVQMSRHLGLEDQDRALMDLCAGLRDIGMIGVPDAVLLKTGALSAADWQVLNRHPVLGAELLRPMPQLRTAANIVRAHHERWDGGGYPDGLRGEDIPLLSRVIAVCDAFVAIASDRPYRRGVGAEGALDHISRERGHHFDPDVVDCLLTTISGSASCTPAMPAPKPAAPSGSDRRHTSRMRAPANDLERAIDDVGHIPAFGPAAERALGTLSFGNMIGRSELIAAIDTDIGLAVAVLRRAQAGESRRPIASVSDAVAALSAEEIREVIETLPRAAFPWQTSSEALLHHARVHAQAVVRAADRIVQIIRPDHGDETLTVALLHDVGKLVLGRVRPDYAEMSDPRRTPEERLRRERRELGIDHASLGGVLLGRWGISEKLASAVAGHHGSPAQTPAARLVQLADLVAHHAQGAAVDRNVMLRLAAACDLPVKSLRDVLFDLPHSAGSQRRRAERSPLSARETAILRSLADGKRSAQIAAELHLSISTVRSHLHNIYGKLKVADRAQAVLLATERAWI
jgi:DNA-binding CsgD family transcriptional regulator/HD-like signal output (HDOD) protein